MAVDKTGLQGGPYGERLIGVLTDIEGEIVPTVSISREDYEALDPPIEGTLYLIEGEGSGDASDIPTGGTTGQALLKESGADGDMGWGDVILGGGGITHLVAITRTAYDALGAPDATTLYVIDEEA